MYKSPHFHTYGTNAISNSSLLLRYNVTLNIPFLLFLTQGSHNYAFLLLAFNALDKNPLKRRKWKENIDLSAA